MSRPHYPGQCPEPLPMPGISDLVIDMAGTDAGSCTIGPGVGSGGGTLSYSYVYIQSLSLTAVKILNEGGCCPSCVLDMLATYPSNAGTFSGGGSCSGTGGGLGDGAWTTTGVTEIIAPSSTLFVSRTNPSTGVCEFQLSATLAFISQTNHVTSGTPVLTKNAFQGPGGSYGFATPWLPVSTLIGTHGLMVNETGGCLGTTYNIPMTCNFSF